MKTKIGLSIAVGCLSLLNVVPVKAISLSFLPTSQTVTLGQSAQVAIQMSELGVGNSPSLGSFDFNVNFDSSILSFKTVSFGDPILGDQLDLEGFIPPDSGFTNISDSIVNIFEVSFDSPDILNQSQADSFILGILTLDSQKSGTSFLSLSNVILGDANGSPLNANLSDGSIIVVNQNTTSVSEPSPLLMLVTFLGGVLIKKIL